MNQLDPIENLDEEVYLDLLDSILSNGQREPNRTGIDTIGFFGGLLRFDLRGKFPLLTTKKMAWKSIVYELLWFLRGDTNITFLQENGVHIWDANAKDYYDRMMKDREDFCSVAVNDVIRREYEHMWDMDHPYFAPHNPNNLGPVYGYQWRNFNGQRIDQISELIKNIKSIKEDPTHPAKRRLMLTAWNPAQIKDMALPPCHCLVQFKIIGNELSCILTQRSCDEFLGVPFNIACYSLLTYMLAHVCGIEAGDFIHSQGDCHIYVNHIDQVKLQCSRTPRPFPQLKINRRVNDIFDFKFEDFELVGYDPYPAIKAEMAV